MIQITLQAAMDSQCAFAKQMGLSAGELSEVLRGKRALSLRSTLRVASSLGLGPAETRHLITLAQLEKSARYGAELPVDPAWIAKRD